MSDEEKPEFINGEVCLTPREMQRLIRYAIKEEVGKMKDELRDITVREIRKIGVTANDRPSRAKKQKTETPRRSFLSECFKEKKQQNPNIQFGEMSRTCHAEWKELKEPYTKQWREERGLPEEGEDDVPMQLPRGVTKGSQLLKGGFRMGGGIKWAKKPKKDEG